MIVVAGIYPIVEPRIDWLTLHEKHLKTSKLVKIKINIEGKPLLKTIFAN